MLPEGCEFKSRTLELEELTGHSRLMRRKVLLRAHFLGFQDDKDPNCHHASPVMPTSCMSSEPALTSCLDSPPATASPGPRPSLPVWTPLRPRRAQAPGRHLRSGLTSSHGVPSSPGPSPAPGGPPPTPGYAQAATLLSSCPQFPIRNPGHIPHSFCLSQGTFVWSPSLAAASYYWSSEHPELFLPNGYHYFSYILVRLFN